MNTLTSELRDLRAQLEEAAATHAQEVKCLQEQARDLGKQRESCLREVSRLSHPLLGSKQPLNAAGDLVQLGPKRMLRFSPAFEDK